jgi:hypothetical protein
MYASLNEHRAASNLSGGKKCRSSGALNGMYKTLLQRVNFSSRVGEASAMGIYFQDALQ